MLLSMAGLSRARSKPPRASSRQLANALAEAGRSFYVRGWALGTSGNFSAVLQREPVRLLITASGLDKSSLNTQHFLEIDKECNVVRGSGRPSAEALLHLAVARVRGASAILHTHSVWSTFSPTFTLSKAASPSRATKCSRASKESKPTSTVNGCPLW